MGKIRLSGSTSIDATCVPTVGPVKRIGGRQTLLLTVEPSAKSHTFSSARVHGMSPALEETILQSMPENDTSEHEQKRDVLRFIRKYCSKGMYQLAKTIGQEKVATVAADQSCKEECDRSPAVKVGMPSEISLDGDSTHSNEDVFYIRHTGSSPITVQLQLQKRQHVPAVIPLSCRSYVTSNSDNKISLPDWWLEDSISDEEACLMHRLLGSELNHTAKEDYLKTRKEIMRQKKISGDKIDDFTITVWGVLMHFGILRENEFEAVMRSFQNESIKFNDEFKCYVCGRKKSKLFEIPSLHLRACGPCATSGSLPFSAGDFLTCAVPGPWSNDQNGKLLKVAESCCTNNQSSDLNWPLIASRTGHSVSECMIHLLEYFEQSDSNSFSKIFKSSVDNPIERLLGLISVAIHPVTASWGAKSALKVGLSNNMSENSEECFNAALEGCRRHAQDVLLYMASTRLGLSLQEVTELRLRLLEAKTLQANECDVSMRADQVHLEKIVMTHRDELYCAFKKLKHLKLQQASQK